MKNLIVMFVLICLFNCKNNDSKKTNELASTNIGNFELSTDKIAPETPYTITYTGQEMDISGTVEFLKDFQSTKTDLNFKDNHATFTVPNGTEAVYFSLKENGTRDFNSGRGHFFPVYVKGKKSKQFSSLTAMYRLESPYMGLQKDPVQFLKTMNEEEKNIEKPSIAFKYFQIRTAKEANKNELVARLVKEFIQTYKHTEFKDEQSLIYLLNIYEENNSTAKVDQLKRKAFVKFPSGKLRKEHFLDQFQGESHPANEKLLLDSINTIFKNSFDELDYILQDKASNAYDENNQEQMLYYANQVRDLIEKAKLYNHLAEKEFSKNKKSKQGMNYIETAFDIIQRKDAILKRKPTYLTINETEGVLNIYRKRILTNLISAKAAISKFDEAASLQELLIEDGKDAEVNQDYITYLIKTNKYHRVIDNATEFYKNGYITNTSIKDLETALLQTGRSEQEVAATLKILEKQCTESKVSRIEKNLIKERAPDFSLENIDGKMVKLSNYKGKVVILDFWATWCGPCKASFPGMQKAVDFYEDDDVVFLFIDTMEFRINNETERRETITSYIQDNAFNFNVLFDEKSAINPNEYQAFKQYNIQSLPTKIFIDKDGFVRYIPSSHSTDPDIILDDIKLIVDIIS